ncbi:hypothetical protein OAI87_00240 [Paracoccaceae bacterium]|nr:hypothetical protein [Paracoccaceae bacterium]
MELNTILPISIDYMNSRPLDVHKWSDYSEVNEFVNEIYLLLTSIKGHERVSKKLLKVLLLDLYVAWCADPLLKLIFSRNNNSYVSKSRYNELHIGKAIIGIVDTLVNHEIIHQKDGFNDRVTGVSFQSRIWASELLVSKFKEVRFNQFQIGSDNDREPVVLRDKKKEPVEYKDTRKTIRMRSVLKKYNQLISNTHIDISDLEIPTLEIGSGKKKQVLQINQQDKFVRRIFNNSRWDQGGRFYGGWWQRCPKEYRERILMDGISTAEIDFSGLHIVILYAQEGINYWLDVNDDPYKLRHLKNIDSKIDLRAAAKLLLLTAINADDESKAFQAFRYQAEKGSLEKKMSNEALSSILSALRQKHKPIAHKLASGAGIDLMYIDSQITEELIKKFTFMGVPILTVHDSYLVPFGYDRILHREMQSAFEVVTDISYPLVSHTTEYYNIIEQEPDPHEQSQKAIFIKEQERVSKRHKKDLSLFKEFKDKPDRESWVADWTMIY